MLVLCCYVIHAHIVCLHRAVIVVSLTPNICLCVVRMFKLTPEVEAQLQGKNFLIALNEYPAEGMMILQRIEGGKWFAATGGNNGKFPSKDEDGMLTYLRDHVWFKQGYDMLKDATPISPTIRIIHLGNTWRRFDKVSRFCTGNPIALKVSKLPVCAAAAAAANDCIACERCCRIACERCCRNMTGFGLSQTWPPVASHSGIVCG